MANVLDTRIFRAPMHIHSAPWLTAQMFEDLQLCMRYSLMAANDRYSMETQAQAWFTVLLDTLRELQFTLYDHTQKTLVYEANRDALGDVFEGYLPPLRAPGPWFQALQTRVENDPTLLWLEVMNASSHLSIELDSEDGVTPVAILFHAYCVTDPAEPTHKLNLTFNHLGARFVPERYAALHEELQARYYERFLADLTQLLAD